jgi:amphi-Trp domain-containing protein
MKNHPLQNHFFHQNYTTDRDDVVSYLEAVKQGFNDGEIVLNDDSREVKILTQPYMDMSVEAYDQEGTIHFSINFSWSSNYKSGLPPESK